MLYTKLYYHFDRDGKLLEKPLLLTAKDTRSKGFELSGPEDHNAHDLRTSMQRIRIERHYANLKTDPWNDDGRPPSVWAFIVHPHISFMFNSVSLFGFEMPNMCWAGIVREAYSMCPPLKLPKARQFTRDVDMPHDISSMKPQLIRLVP